MFNTNGTTVYKRKLTFIFILIINKKPYLYVAAILNTIPKKHKYYPPSQLLSLHLPNYWQNTWITNKDTHEIYNYISIKNKLEIV